ncbi:MFS transporter [Stappia taiwanensis]|uniref:MFS transporter n=1 Tax=Stappia taiwanensis TaxID=992267 RepID=A0A838XSE4_9HYPH|nr:MFS transporter [Stappia taiwanensis]MBA4612667.1 MFS transporter [Stappia taiwanensis]GGE88620.1 MFS transporter [Stappia taiwanensis]
MKSPLSHPAFRTLFAAQICSLLGVGLLTVALSLAAYRIGGDAAGGRVLGMLLALKMVAYVGLAPLAEGLFAGRNRKQVMVGLDAGRMLLLLPMLFVTETWQIAGLAFAFFVLAAGFTPLFQSVIPDVLPDEETYTRALAWSRIAYTLEAVLSPVIAALVLRLVAPETLFLFAALAFAGSVAFLLTTAFPATAAAAPGVRFLARAAKGLRIYRRTPRLRGLFLLNLALSLAMAWVLVNTVVYAGRRFGDAETLYPLLMACYGGGAALGALLVPRLVERRSERSSMLMGVFGFAALGAGFALSPPVAAALPFAALPFAVWAGFGLLSSLVLTPGGLVITRSSNREDRASVFAAQFSLSHAGWLLAYPLAGWLASRIALETTLLILCGLAALVALAASRVWPAHDPLTRPHAHPELPPDHPHLREAPASGSDHHHSHVYRIDDLHPCWTPMRG